MASILNAKRKTVTATYEFLDGSTTSITVQSLSTNDDLAVGNMKNDPKATLADMFEKAVRIHLQQNEAETVNRIVREQYEEGFIVDFAKSLKELIEEAKKGKSNG